MKELLKHISPLPLIFGGAAISGEGGGYGFGDISDSDSHALLDFAIDSGVKIFDTAPIYGFGLSEKRMGEAFKGRREDQFVISKCGITWHDNMRVDLNNDPKVATKMLEQTLRDLQSDYVDMYMIHWPDPRTDIRKTMEVLAKAKIDGKIKHIGLCNTNMSEIKLALEIDEIEAIQNGLNIFDRAGIETVEDFLNESGASFMSWGTFDKGIVTGRAVKGRHYDKSDARSWAPWWKKSNYKQKIAKMEKILPFLKERGHTGVELALSYNLSLDNSSHVICGARNQAQLENVLSSLKNPLSSELLSEVMEMVCED